MGISGAVEWKAEGPGNLFSKAALQSRGSGPGETNISSCTWMEMFILFQDIMTGILCHTHNVLTSSARREQTGSIL